MTDGGLAQAVWIALVGKQERVGSLAIDDVSLSGIPAPAELLGP